MPDLWASQVVSRDFLKERRRAYLADVPGWPGKTPPAIRAATELGVERPLVICPAIAREMWSRQWVLWGAPSVTPTVLSYTELALHGYDIGEHDLLIGDEIHRCRNITAKQTKAMMKLMNRAPACWLLSGTPMVKHCGDFYPVLRALWPDYLRAQGITSYREYMDRFAVTVPTDYGFKVVANKNVAVLREMLDRIMLRRHSYAGMPPLTWENYYLPEMPRIEPDHIAWAVEIEARLYAGEWTDLPETKSVSTARRLLGEMKAPVVGKLISDELEAGAYHKIVIGYYHRAVGDRLLEQLAEFNPLRIDGQTPRIARDASIDLFQNDPKRQVFLGQIEACGEAITLNAASEIALVEQMWNPEANFQFVKRVHRGTQDRPCRARLFYAPSPIDEAVARVLTRKAQQRGEIIS